MADLTDLTGVVPPVQLIELDDAPFSVTYTFPAKDFGAGDFTESFETPVGFRGLVRAISLFDVTEVFSTTTTQARINLGVPSGDADAYAYTGGLGALQVAASDSPVVTHGVTRIIPANSEVTFQGIAPTGGTPTGIATVAITVQYFL